MPFEGVLVEAYKGTRRTLNLDRLAIQLASMDSRFSLKLLLSISAWKGLAFAEAPSLAVFRSNFITN